MPFSGHFANNIAKTNMITSNYKKKKKKSDSYIRTQLPWGCYQFQCFSSIFTAKKCKTNLFNSFSHSCHAALQDCFGLSFIPGKRSWHCGRGIPGWRSVHQDAHTWQQSSLCHLLQSVEFFLPLSHHRAQGSNSYRCWKRDCFTFFFFGEC